MNASDFLEFILPLVLFNKKKVRVDPGYNIRIKFIKVCLKRLLRV